MDVGNALVEGPGASRSVIATKNYGEQGFVPSSTRRRNTGALCEELFGVIGDL